MPNPNDATKMLSPKSLAEQLFDGALRQNVTDPRQAAGQVIAFLTEALFYAVTSSKNDPIVFLTETLIYAVSSSEGDETARKELLKHISDTIANAPLIQFGKAPAPGAPTPGAPAPAGKPAGKP